MRRPRQSRIRTAHVTVQALLLLASMVALTVWIAPTGFTATRLEALETLSPEENLNSSGKPNPQAIPPRPPQSSSTVQSGFAQLMSSIDYLPTTTLPSLISIWRNQDKNASEDGVWQEIEETSLMKAQSERSIVPKFYRTLRLNQSALKRLLSQAPIEFTDEAKSIQILMTLPMPDGSFTMFRIEESPIMEPELIAKFPEIRTYRGQGIDDPTATTRFDWMPSGFHAMIISERGTVYIDPYTNADTNNYISFYKGDTQKDVGSLECLFSEANVASTDPHGRVTPNIASGQTLRTYRLAVAATGEYTALFGGTVNGALLGITAAVNRVNAIYERELAIHLNLIANETNIIYTNATTDPYTNGSLEVMLVQNHENLNLDPVVGINNYDIGHVFGTIPPNCSTSPNCHSGKARLGVVCDSLLKAYGGTLSSNPVGNVFYVDYVAHEIGHQFGAHHTFNANTGSCGTQGQRNPSTAYEPGSGSTIMAYAGTCGPQDLQPQSDDYFHTISHEEIVSFVTNGIGNNCDSPTATGNTPPTVNAGPNFTIPKKTPFKLTANGSDVDGQTVTYSWEEFDSCLPQFCSAPTTLPNTDATDGVTRPIFRSFKWTIDPSRTFPDISVLVNNPQGERYQQSLKGESLPTIARPMLFRVTARDNFSGGGGINSDQMQVDISNAGPFVVTQPNLATTWTAGSSRVITWEVAGTSGAPVNCANVRISLSTDRGNSFFLLLSSTPNDGTQAITVPNNPTSGAAARLKIEAIGNIFFDVSQTFTINPGGGGGTDTTNPTVNITSPTNNSTHATSGSTLTLRGWATDNVGVTQVTCANSRGGSCTVSTALPDWVASVTGLQSGTNVLTVTARDAAGRAGSDTLTVTYTPPPTCGNGTSVNYRINGGPPLHPNGTLIKISTDPTVYLIQSGQKRGIPSQAILNNLYQNGGFDFEDVITVASDEFSRYPTGAVVGGTLPSNGRTQPDGRLIQRPGSSEISIVTNGGQRRPFTSEGAFLGLGYLYCNVVSASDYDSYPAGPPADSSTVLSFSSIEPSQVQTRDWGEQVTYTFTVVDGNGAPVSGAAVGGQDNLRGIGVFLATPATDSNGQGTYTTMVPNGTSNATYDITFFADKSGYTESQGVTRQVGVSHTLTELAIASVEPSALQTRDWGGSVSYTITVRDSTGNPVSGAAIVGEDDLRGTIFTTSPSSTNGSGQITYTTTVPNGSSNLIYGISFIAQKPGFIESPIVSRHVQVNHFAQTTIFTVTNTNDSGAGSLRQTILDANGTPGVQTVAFNIPGSGVQTITPLSALPTITDPVLIDGTTQPAFSGSPVIELNGSSAGSVDGLLVTGGNSTIKGLVINRFSFGILLRINGNNVIQGNYIGTDATGSIPLGNRGGGIVVDIAPNNLIGGTAPGARNLVSGNTRGFTNGAISIQFSSGNIIQGNFIGTDATGTVALSNGGGIQICCNSNFTLIGGTVPEARNVISGNENAGITLVGTQLSGLVSDTLVQGNYIGTDLNGMVALGNGSGVVVLETPNNLIGGTTPTARNIISGNRGPGVSISNSSLIKVQGNFIGTQINGIAPLGNTGGSGVEIGGPNNLVGGLTASSANTIAFNSGYGVTIVGASNKGNAVLSNSIFSNSFLGIDLGFDGVTANDPSDTDLGPNNLQNNPTLASATVSSNSTTVQGTLNSTANTVFNIQVFSNMACDPAGNGEGQSFFGSTSVTTDSTGNASFTSTFPFTLAGGQVVTATATDVDNNTSEFSACVQVSGVPTPTPTPMTIQFASAVTSVGESGGSATVTVNRLGNNSGVATVNYATSDLAALANCNVVNSSNASSRCDYATGIGRLSFAAGETSKTIAVLVVDDGYGEGDEQFSITLSNAVGASLGAISAATVTINDNETVNGGNPIDQAGFFAREHYLDFFSREPDPSGLAFWTDQITSCGADTACIELRRINVSAAFFLSIEFQQTGYLVYRMYKAAYGNVPGTPAPVRFSEFLPDTQQIGLGVVVGQTGWEQVLENNKNLFAADFAERSRFITAHLTTLTPAELVDRMFANAGVTPTAAERDAAISEFGVAAVNTADAAARGRALRRVAENPTLAQQESNKAFVLMQYLGYLRRNPNDAPDGNFDGYNFWLGKLNQFNGNFVNAEMVKAFIVSGEYKQRFGP